MTTEDQYIIPDQKNQKIQMNQWLRQKTTGKRIRTGKSE